MTTLPRRPLGSTGLDTAELVFGTSGLGQRSTPDDALAALRGAAAAGLHDWDTSNNYGRAEEYIGVVLPEMRDAGIQVFTKADPLAGDTDFSGRRVRASVAESLERLGVDRLPVVHLHDPERIPFEAAMAPDGPVRALLALREEGVIEHIGVAGGPVALLERFVRTGEFELLVTHNRFTLLDRSADSLLSEAASRGMAVFNAAPFGGGALTSDDGPVGNYHYRPVDSAQRAAVLTLRRIAGDAGVPLGAVALQLSLRDPRVTAVIVGASRPAHLDAVLHWAAQEVPEAIWPAVDAALPSPEHQTGPHGR